jgi:hypothetical protein
MKYYKTIQINTRQVRLHRYVMECHLNRVLKSSELVHHKDGNKFNNNIDNLELISRDMHIKVHKPEHFNKYKITKEKLKLQLETNSPKQLAIKYGCCVALITYNIRKWRLKYKRYLHS